MSKTLWRMPEAELSKILEWRVETVRIGLRQLYWHLLSNWFLPRNLPEWIELPAFDVLLNELKMSINIILWYPNWPVVPDDSVPPLASEFDVRRFVKLERTGEACDTQDHMNPAICRVPATYRVNEVVEKCYIGFADPVIVSGVHHDSGRDREAEAGDRR